MLPMTVQAGEHCQLCSSPHASGMLATYMKDSALADYDVGFYWIDIEVSDSSTYVRGNTVIHATALQEIEELVLELSIDLQVDSIFIDGLLQNDFEHQNDLIRIHAEPLIPGSGIFEVKVFYQGAGGQSSFFAGISNRTDYYWKQKVTYTLSESFNAHDWFVCKQVLTDKADSAYIFLTTPDRLKAGSNGLLTGIDSLPGNRVKYKWKTNYPLAYYLLSLSVADYQDYSYYVRLDQAPDSTLFQNYIYNNPSCLQAYKDGIDLTCDMLKFYSGIFGIYPFWREKYGHSLAPIGGGMEHQTMTTLHNFDFNLVAHELAHQWFGDNVTCASWQDIWINEGFASYGEYLTLEALKSKQLADVWMKDAHYQALSEPEGSVYVPLEDSQSERRIFSGALSYKKGAALLHTLRGDLNDDTLFFRVLRNFQDEFRDSTATARDFLRILNEISGREYDWFFDQWYYGKGYPNHTFNWWQFDDKLFLHGEQSGSSVTNSIFRLAMEFKIEFPDGTDTLVRLDIDKNTKQFELPVRGEVSGIVADPDNWILDKSIVIQKYRGEGQFYVSPNPFDDQINLVFKTDASREISLADLNGKVVQRWKSISAIVNLQTHRFEQGVYLLKVREGTDTYTARIVKQ